MDDLHEARVEAVEELTRALFKTAGDILIRHGDDPQSEAIFAAAVALFIDRTDAKIRPGFKRNLIRLLQGNEK